MKCTECNEVEFEPVRSTAKYCSLKCRVRAFRKRVSVTQDVTVGNNQVTLVTVKVDGGYEEVLPKDLEDMIRSGDITYDVASNQWQAL